MGYTGKDDFNNVWEKGYNASTPPRHNAGHIALQAQKSLRTCSRASGSPRNMNLVSVVGLGCICRPFPAGLTTPSGGHQPSPCRGPWIRRRGQSGFTGRVIIRKPLGADYSMGWGPFGAPGWGYDVVSPPIKRLGPHRASALHVFALRSNDVSLQVAHARGLGCCCVQRHVLRPVRRA